MKTAQPAEESACSTRLSNTLRQFSDRVPDFKLLSGYDNELTFLNVREFGVMKEITLWRKGYRPGNIEYDPDVFTIPVVIDVDEVSSETWNKNSQRARAGSTIMYQKDDIALHQMLITMYARQEDFGDVIPKKNQRLAMDNKAYKITQVENESGMLVIHMEEFSD